jgi:NAD-dependent dihydropyrimidine dehydrogenase PreA subunit
MALRYLKNVASIEIDAAKCSGCGLCLNVCPHRVLELRERKAVVADRDACMECGACKVNCPHQAVRVEAGVGCANAIIRGMIHGTAPTCGDREEGPQSAGCGG